MYKASTAMGANIFISIFGPNTVGNFKKYPFGSKRTIVILLELLLIITIVFMVALVITILHPCNYNCLQLVILCYYYFVN